MGEGWALDIMNGIHAVMTFIARICACWLVMLLISVSHHRPGVTFLKTGRLDFAMSPAETKISPKIICRRSTFHGGGAASCARYARLCVCVQTRCCMAHCAAKQCADCAAEARTVLYCFPYITTMRRESQALSIQVYFAIQNSKNEICAPLLSREARSFVGTNRVVPVAMRAVIQNCEEHNERPLAARRLLAKRQRESEEKEVAPLTV